MGWGSDCGAGEGRPTHRCVPLSVMMGKGCRRGRRGVYSPHPPPRGFGAMESEAGDGDATADPLVATTMPLRGLTFVVTPDDVKEAVSVVEVTEAGLYDRKGRPKLGGLLDPRMGGGADRSLLCATCHRPACDGHPGHIRLAAPVYQADQAGLLRALLQCACAQCAAFRFALPWPELEGVQRGSKRLNAAAKAVAKLLRCPSCDAPLPLFPAGKTAEQKLRPWWKWRPKAAPRSEEEAAWMARPFTAADARRVLTFLPFEGLRWLGFVPERSHPRHLVFQVLSVTPPSCRPSLRLTDGGGSRSQDDATLNYVDVLKANGELAAAQAALRELQRRSASAAASADADGGTSSAKPPDPAQLAEAAVAVQEFEFKLQARVAALLRQGILKSLPRLRGETDAAMVSGASKRQRSDTTKLMAGKTGLFRGNLVGKRLDFNARLVVSPDAGLLQAWQVGVPACVMDEQTYPERVTAFNLRRLREAVARGGDHPDGGGALFVVLQRDGGASRALRGRTPAQLAELAAALEAGDVVERQFVDGDYVLVNRQPTLWEHSMMAAVAIRSRDPRELTLRLPVALCRAFNADFDGDEMNLHFLQTEEARAEAAELLLVPHNVVSGQAGGAIVGCVQDAVVGLHGLTAPDALLSREEALELAQRVHWPAKAAGWDAAEQPPLHLPPFPLIDAFLAASGGAAALPQPAILKLGPRGGARWTGSQVASWLLPQRLRWRPRAKRGAHGGDRWTLRPLGQQEAEVVDGTLVCGRLDKDATGPVTGGLVQAIHRAAGGRANGGWAAAKFVSDAQRVAGLWMAWASPCVSIGDCTPAPDLVAEVDGIVGRAVGAADALTAACAAAGEAAAAEAQLHDLFSRAHAEAGRAALRAIERVAATGYRNGLAAIAASGAKGSAGNLAQMTAFLGQQTLWGERPALLPTRGGPRALPCFAPGDGRPEARGFTASCYYSGLSPQEQITALRAGRQSLVEVASSTSVTGYGQRRMVKALEGQVKCASGEVRAASGAVVQWRFGGTDVDPTRARPVTLTRPAASGGQPTAAAAAALEGEGVAWPYEARLPCSFDVRPDERADPSWVPCDEALLTVWREADAAFGRRPAGADPDATWWAPWVGFPLPRAAVDPGWLTRHAAALLVVRPVPAAALARWLAELQRGCVEAGESVGAKAGTFIGEPSTQTMLNFHRAAGQRSANISVTGLPRMKQLMGAADTRDSGNMVLPVAGGEAEARAAVAALRRLTVRKAVRSSSCLQEPLSAVLRPSAPAASRAPPESQQAGAGGGPATDAAHAAGKLAAEAVQAALEEAAREWGEAHTRSAPAAKDAALRVKAALMANRAAAAAVSRSDGDFTSTSVASASQPPASAVTAATLLLQLRGTVLAEHGATLRSVGAACEAALGGGCAVRLPPWSTQRPTLALVLPSWATRGDEDDDAPPLPLDATVGAVAAMEGLVAVGVAAGVPTVVDATCRQRDPAEEGGGWVVETLGSDLHAALRAAWGLVHPHLARTNNVMEVAAACGVEAGSLALAGELHAVVTAGGSSVGREHAQLVADTQCLTGAVSQLTREKMEEMGNGVLQRMGFEKALAVMADAAAFATADPLSGATERVIVGQPIAAGTGTVAVLSPADACPPVPPLARSRAPAAGARPDRPSHASAHRPTAKAAPVITTLRPPAKRRARFLTERSPALLAVREIAAALRPAEPAAPPSEPCEDVSPVLVDAADAAHACQRAALGDGRSLTASRLFVAWRLPPGTAREDLEVFAARLRHGLGVPDQHEWCHWRLLATRDGSRLVNRAHIASRLGVGRRALEDGWTAAREATARATARCRGDCGWRAKWAGDGVAWVACQCQPCPVRWEGAGRFAWTHLAGGCRSGPLRHAASAVGWSCGDGGAPAVAAWCEGDLCDASWLSVTTVGAEEGGG